jgi:hypothetical protein
MHHHACRLVHDDQVIILIDDIQRDGLAGWLGFACRRDGNREYLPGFDPVGGVS